MTAPHRDVTGRSVTGCGVTAVAIPARDEADRIGACLRAVLDQRDADGRRLPPDRLHVVVVANNCVDDTAAVIARAVDASRVRVIAVDLPPAHAHVGTARRMAMDAAAALLPDGGEGLICTTDADSRPRPDWIAQLWRAIGAGAEAVAGVVDFDDAEGPLPLFPYRRGREAEYGALQAEIAARVDPLAHDPWPNHVWAWGANLAVTRDAYRRVGGLEPEPLAEDRAFVARLHRHDVRVRHALDARVWTSARCDGRAPGGLSWLVRDHAGVNQAACDAALEPARDVLRRSAWRARLRRRHHRGDPPSPRWSPRLGLPHHVDLASLLAHGGFGAAWSAVEAQSRRLQPRRLQPHELDREIVTARRLLRALRRDASDDRDDSARVAAAGLWSASAARL